MTTTSDPRTNAYPGRCRLCAETVPAAEGRLIDRTGGGRARSIRPDDRWEIEHLDRALCDRLYAESPAGQADTRGRAAALARQDARRAQDEADAARAVERRVGLGLPFDPYATRGGWDLADGSRAEFVVRKLRDGGRRVVIDGYPSDVSGEHSAARLLCRMYGAQVRTGKAV